MEKFKYLQNLHTHTTYCDGKNTCEELVQKAIELGFNSLGFAGHSYTEYSSKFCMSQERTELYKKEIAHLKEKYKGAIELYCGIEFDSVSTDPLLNYDYVIATVHALTKDGAHFSIDAANPQVAKENIEKYLDGDFKKAVKLYYETVANLPKKAKRIDIAGHFDIITKYSEKDCFFNVDYKEYKDYALQALHALAEKVDIFEVNTGAMSRGYRTVPYPQSFILKELKTLNKGLVIGSDCHNKEHLDFWFDNALEFIKEQGFKEVYTFNGKGFTPHPL
jgi:histidinol-phosphatase (PHP family)